MATLPQDDTANAQRRQAQLDFRRSLYDYQIDALPPVPRLKGGLPPLEHFDAAYQAAADARLATATANHISALITSLPFDELDDYADLYPLVERPRAAQFFNTDHGFAEQRLSGANPMVLTRVDDAHPLPGDCRVTDDVLKYALGPGHTFDEAIGAGRLYFADYSILLGLDHGLQPRPKYLPAPLGLFYWRTLTGHENWGELVPVAIQLRKRNGGFEVVGPHHGYRWSVAKWCLQIADANHHEMATHLCRTHLILEAFVIAAERNLADDHPLLPLLRTHLRFLLAINTEARRRLVGQHQFVDNLLGGTLDASLTIVKRSYDAFRFWTHARLPAELQSRGFSSDPADPLPHYPYRDDGELVWDALERWITSFVELAYPDDGAVAADTELQAMVAELVDPAKGAVRELAPGDEVKTRDVLAQVLTAIVWTSGPQHSAVNYPQWDYVGFVPNLPLAAYQNPEERSPPPLELLPPLAQSIEQVDTMFFLATYRYDRLGSYQAPFDDPRVNQKVAELRLALFDIDDRIERRNARRKIAYPYLRPTNITNSTSV